MVQAKSAYYDRIGSANDVLQVGINEIPDPKANEVQVEIAFSGINPSDVKIRAGQRGNLQFPRQIPHSDGSGIIRQAGADVKKFRSGDKVWLYNAAWNRAQGTAATLCTLPADCVQHLPANTNLETGACLGIPALTAAASLLSLNCASGAIVMITGGAGSVGLFAIQLAKFLGFQVITTISSSAKEELARSVGADFCINYKNDMITDQIKQFTAGQYLDGIVDVDFGGNLNWSIAAVKDNATIATYASMGNPNPVLPFYQMMFKQIALRPIFAYTLSSDLRERAVSLINRALENNALKAVIHHIYDLDQIVAAHEAVESAEKAGQVLLRVNDIS